MRSAPQWKAEDMADDPAKTNITDQGDERGQTVTTLVSTHDRGSLAYNERVGNGDPFGPDKPPAPPVTATGATAGTPGTWTPSGATAPAAPTGITASPATAWTTGEHVILSGGGHTHWDGAAWAGGDAP